MTGFLALVGSGEYLDVMAPVERSLLALVDGAGLIYLSGGDPPHCAAALRGTPVWDAILAA